jgi:DNA-directed RNA polymerase specialized sigma24 family protein
LDADDIVQDAVLRAYQAFDSVRGENVKPWLLGRLMKAFTTAMLFTDAMIASPGGAMA